MDLCCDIQPAKLDPLLPEAGGLVSGPGLFEITAMENSIKLATARVTLVALHCSLLEIRLKVPDAKLSSWSVRYIGVRRKR